MQRSIELSALCSISKDKRTKLGPVNTPCARSLLTRVYADGAWATALHGADQVMEGLTCLFTYSIQPSMYTSATLSSQPCSKAAPAEVHDSLDSPLDCRTSCPKIATTLLYPIVPWDQLGSVVHAEAHTCEQTCQSANLSNNDSRCFITVNHRDPLLAEQPGSRALPRSYATSQPSNTHIILSVAN